MRLTKVPCTRTVFLFGLPLKGITQNKPRHPNILIIMTNQQRWDAMRCAGNLEIITPKMDRFAKEGVMINNDYSACLISAPLRTAFSTQTNTQKLDDRNQYSFYC